MRFVTDLETFNEVSKKLKPGLGFMVNFLLFMELVGKEILKLKENNRAPEENAWGPSNYYNFFERIFAAFKNFESLTKEDLENFDYFGELSSITIEHIDGQFYINDGGHRMLLAQILYYLDTDILKKYTLVADCFYNKVLDELKNGKLSDETLYIFSKAFFPLKCSDGNPIHYTGDNSAKPMKAQQKIRVTYQKNKLFSSIQESVKKGNFSLKVSGKDALQTSASDTIAFLGFLGGDSKSSRNATSEYILSKYTDENDLKKLVSFSKELTEIFENTYYDCYSFAFRGCEFKSEYISGLLIAALKYSLIAVASKHETFSGKIKVEVPKNKDLFFEVLENSLKVLNSKKFKACFTKKNFINQLSLIIPKGNATGSFKTGEPFANIIMSYAVNPLL